MTMKTMTDDLRQLLVDAAAALEDLTDDTDETGDDGRDLAGRLRDAAAGERGGGRKQSNVDRYADLLHRWGADPDAGIAAVHGRGGDGLGLSESLGPDYTGEAGFSQRLRVYWSNGEVTLCCVKGMTCAGEDENCPGEAREWWIR